MGVAPGVNVYESCLPPWKKLWNVLTQQCRRISGTGNSLFPGSWLHPWTTWPPRQLFLSTEGNLISNQLCVLHLHQTPQRNGGRGHGTPGFLSETWKVILIGVKDYFLPGSDSTLKRQSVTEASKQAGSSFRFNLRTKASVVTSGLAPL